MIIAAGEVDQIVDYEGAAFLISLHHEADAMVAGQIGIGNQGFHQIEREFEAVGFFGVDVDADVVFFAEQE